MSKKTKRPQKLFEDEITCPYCGFVFCDSCEKPLDGVQVCDECGKKFSYERVIDVTYSSYGE